MSWSTYELRLRLVPWNGFKPSSKIFLLTVPRWYFFCESFALFMYCVCHAYESVHCCLVVTCWERADLLALVCDFNCVFCHFLMWYHGQVWYLIVMISDFCHLSNFKEFGCCKIKWNTKSQRITLVLGCSKWSASLLTYDMKMRLDFSIKCHTHIAQLTKRKKIESMPLLSNYIFNKEQSNPIRSLICSKIIAHRENEMKTKQTTTTKYMQ